MNKRTLVFLYLIDIAIQVSFAKFLEKCGIVSQYTMSSSPCCWKLRDKKYDYSFYFAKITSDKCLKLKPISLIGHQQKQLEKSLTNFRQKPSLKMFGLSNWGKTLLTKWKEIRLRNNKLLCNRYKFCNLITKSNF